ncbi:hypothetical protein [Kineococcus arenarius]|uniref:hypothetical protein n=1 Tax=Kineococcus sp. SYSU DK007 TaxID=3383128 RepID=UPI003D7E7586
MSTPQPHPLPEPSGPRVVRLQPVLATAVPATGLVASVVLFAQAGPGTAALVAGGALLTGAALRWAHRTAALARNLRALGLSVPGSEGRDEVDAPRVRDAGAAEAVVPARGEAA